MFLIARVHDKALAHLGLVITECVGLFEKAINKSRLAVVNVRDDRDISY
jgi:hypothetical protein